MTYRARARRVRTAYHEAGHAIAAFELGVPFREVSIAATTDSWGHLLSTPLRLREPDVYTMSPRTRDRLERRIIVGLAGREGNRLLTGRYDHRGAGNDYQQAGEIARSFPLLLSSTGALGAAETAYRETGCVAVGLRVHTASPVMATRTNAAIAAGTGRCQT